MDQLLFSQGSFSPFLWDEVELFWNSAVFLLSVREVTVQLLPWQSWDVWHFWEKSSITKTKRRLFQDPVSGGGWVKFPTS